MDACPKHKSLLTEFRHMVAGTVKKFQKNKNKNTGPVWVKTRKPGKRDGLRK